MTVQVNKLFTLSVSFNEKGEDLRYHAYIKEMRALLAVVSKKANENNTTLTRKNIALDDLSIITLKKATRIALFHNTNIIVHAYKAFIRKLSVFIDICTNYKPKHDNIHLLSDIVLEAITVMNQAVTLFDIHSRRLVMLTDRYGYLSASEKSMDDALDSEYIKKTIDIEENIDTFMSTVSKMVEEDGIEKDTTEHDDNHGENHSDDHSDNKGSEEELKKTSSDSDDKGDIKDKGGIDTIMNDISSINVDDDSTGFHIVPNKTMNIEKDINDENSFDP